MKKRILISVLSVVSLVLTLLLVAFPSQAAAPFVSPIGPAVTYTDSYSVPWAINNWVPCAFDGQGEFVFLSGDLEILSHTTYDPVGGYHSTFTVRPDKITGVGETSGDRYRTNGTSVTVANYLNLPYSDTSVSNFVFVGKGPGNNFLAHTVYKVTVNANGELTALVLSVNVECR